MAPLCLLRFFYDGSLYMAPLDSFCLLIYLHHDLDARVPAFYMYFLHVYSGFGSMNQTFELEIPPSPLPN